MTVPRLCFHACVRDRCLFRLGLGVSVRTLTFLGRSLHRNESATDLSGIIIVAFLCAVWICATVSGQDSSLPPAAREWTDSTGKFKVEASFVRFDNGNVVLKRKDSGQEIRLPILRLSEADQQRARKLQSAMDRQRGKPATDDPSKIQLSIDSDQETMLEITDRITKATGFTVFLDSMALEEIGISPRMRVDLKAEGTLQEVVLRLAQVTELQAVFLTHAVVLTTEEGLGDHYQLAAYQLSPAAMRRNRGRGMVDFSGLMQKIQKIQAPSWEAMGGMGTMSPFPPNGLLVRQSPPVLNDITTQFAGELRRLPDRPSLSKPLNHLVSIDGGDASLEKCLATLKADSSIGFRIDERSLNEVGLGSDMRLRIQSLQNCPLHLVLDLVLGKQGLTWAREKDGVVVGGSEESLPKTTVSYPLGSLRMGAAAQMFPQVIQSVVTPEQWLSLGGPATLRIQNGTLYVDAHDETHREIAKLLAIMTP